MQGRIFWHSRTSWQISWSVLLHSNSRKFHCGWKWSSGRYCFWRSAVAVSALTDSDSMQGNNAEKIDMHFTFSVWLSCKVSCIFHQVQMAHCNNSSSDRRRLPTFLNFKWPHLQLPAPHPCPLSTLSAPSSSDTPNVKWQMWNSLQIMFFLWRGVGWKCHYAHALIELLRWPPAAGVDFHLPGCRSGGSISSLSSDLRAKK